MFAPRGLSCRDDADAFAAFGVDYGHQLAGGVADDLKALLAVVCVENLIRVDAATKSAKLEK
jgi:hypothetical protein